MQKAHQFLENTNKEIFGIEIQAGAVSSLLATPLIYIYYNYHYLCICLALFSYPPSKNETVKILMNGQLYSKTNSSYRIYNNDEFCVENLDGTLNVFICFQSENISENIENSKLKISVIRKLF